MANRPALKFPPSSITVFSPVSWGMSSTPTIPLFWKILDRSAQKNREAIEIPKGIKALFPELHELENEWEKARDGYEKNRNPKTQEEVIRVGQKKAPTVSLYLAYHKRLSE